MILRNFKANYISQLFTILVTFVSTPFLVQILGVEAYGLVGLNLSIQAAFMLLDFGLAGGIIKECAKDYYHIDQKLRLTKYLNTSELAFILISITGGLFLYGFGGLFYENWTNSEVITSKTLMICFNLISLSVAIRFISGQYRSIYVGRERQKELSILNISFNFLKHILVFAILYYSNNSIIVYFSYQLCIVFLELLVLWKGSRRFDQKLTSVSWSDSISVKIFSSTLKFSGSVALISLLWVVAIQFDKMLLTRILNITEYGYYSLAVTLSGAILLFNAPINTAILPRLSYLHSIGRYNDVNSLYLTVSQLLFVICFPIALVMFILADHILFFWTGLVTTIEYSYILKYHVAGTVGLLISGIPFLFAYAYEKLKFNIVANIIFLIILLPIYTYLVINYSLKSALIFWCILCLSFMLIFTSIFHIKHNSGFAVKWFVKVIAEPILFLLPGVFIVYNLNFEAKDRIISFVYVTISYIIIVLPYIIFRFKSIIEKIKNYEV